MHPVGEILSIGRVHTAPADLTETALSVGLETGWALRTETLTYRPVGFGSHHWEVLDATGVRWFVTVDDLRSRRMSAAEPLPICLERLQRSLSTAMALRPRRDFVVAPRPTRAGEPLVRLGEFFVVAVYPYVAGQSFDSDTYTPEHRSSVLDLLVSVHAAPPEIRKLALVDDYVLPFADTVAEALDGSPGDHSGLGPFAQRALDVLVAHATGVRRALVRYDDLVAEAGTHPPELVLTHGEPHPGNTMRSNGELLLIDWDTALVAPAERDLWDLDPGDGSVHVAYTTKTGRSLRPELMELYRLRWDLVELAMCLHRFSQPHGRTTDDEETWTILEDTTRSLQSRA